MVSRIYDSKARRAKRTGSGKICVLYLVEGFGAEAVQEKPEAQGSKQGAVDNEFEVGRRL